MALFGSNLAEVDSRLFENLKKTKAVFPEETQRIEWGLDLMRNLTQITKEASKDYPTRPNLYANHNLFARNRQLLVNAYVCLLFSSYGTQFVIARKQHIEHKRVQLCNYTHPNFVGWQELMGEKGEGEFILNIPAFSTTNSETGIGVTLFLMQVSFKSFVETFKGYLARFAYQLEEWQDNFNRLIPRFQDSEKT
jgi:hypothetical protein